MPELPRTVMVVTEAVVKFADDEAGLATADEYQCQVNAAALTAAPNLQTVPATGCSPESQVPAATSWTLDLTWLQSWDSPGGGLSFYAYTHDTEEKAFSIAASATAEPLATGTVRVVAGPYLGQFGTVLQATASWPVQGRPTITAPAPVVAAAEADDAEADTEADHAAAVA
jgi:hypothetical protein